MLCGSLHRGGMLTPKTRAGITIYLPAQVLSIVDLMCVDHQVSATGVENLDLTEVIKSNHFNYNRKMPEILELLDLDNCSKYIGRGDPREREDGSSAAVATPGLGATSEHVVYGTTVVP